MSVRFYVVDKVGTGTIADPLRPKYFRELGVSNLSAMDYGFDNTYLVGADVTQQQHVDLTSNVDVLSVPQALDNQIGLVALSTVQSRLESLHIPADWVTAQHTYRDIIRITGKIFLFMQRFSARQQHTFFESGVTLDTRMNQLTQAQRNALLDAATNLGLDTAGVTGQSTVRQVLRLIVQQMRSFSLAGEVF